MIRTASCPHYGFSSAPECAGFLLAPNAQALTGSLLPPAYNHKNLSSTSTNDQQEVTGPRNKSKNNKTKKKL